jgi:hypothetical protein
VIEVIERIEGKNGGRLGYRGKVFIRVEVRNYLLIDVIVYFL